MHWRHRCPRIRTYSSLNKNESELVNIWNSSPNHVVGDNTGNLFETRLDRLWANQDIRYDFTGDLIGIGNRLVYEICETFLVHLSNALIVRGR